MKKHIQYLTVLMFLINYSAIYSQKNEKILIPFLVKDKWGLSDTLGNIKIKEFAEKITPFFINEESKSRYKVTENGINYLIDESNSKIITKKNGYDDIEVNSKQIVDIYYVYKNNKIGVFHNKEVVPPIYDRLYLTSNESIIVYKNYKRGLYNSEGKLIIPPYYNFIQTSTSDEDFKEKKYVWIATDSINIEHKFYDISIYKKEKFETPPPPPLAEIINITEHKYTPKINDLKKEYEKVDEFSYYGLAIVHKDNKVGMYGLESKQLLTQIEYDEISDLGINNKNKKLFVFKKQGYYGIINQDGKIVLESKYNNIFEGYWGTIIIERENRKGVFLTDSIYPVIEPKYKNIEKFYEIPVNKYWIFVLYKAELLNGKSIFVGENGIEYYSE